MMQSYIRYGRATHLSCEKSPVDLNVFNKTTKWTLALKCKCRIVNHYQSKKAMGPQRFMSTQQTNIPIMFRSSKQSTGAEQWTHQVNENGTDAVRKLHAVGPQSINTSRPILKSNVIMILLLRMPTNQQQPKQPNRESVTLCIAFFTGHTLIWFHFVCFVVLIL